MSGSAWLLSLVVGATSAALMVSELALTRIFSVVIWYHFAFLAVSVALFGTGVAALRVHLRAHSLGPAEAERGVARGLAGLSASLVLVAGSLTGRGADWFVGNATVFTPRLALIFLLVALPFMLGGRALALALLLAGSAPHRAYRADLLGAALACPLAVGLLGVLGGPGALLAAAALAAIASAVATRLSPEEARPRGAPLLAAASLAVGVLAYATGGMDVLVGKGADLGALRPEFDRWNAFSRITVFPVQGFRGWGASPRFVGDLPEQKLLLVDLNAATVLTRFNGELAAAAFARRDLGALVHELRPAAGEVCVVGAGGGKDVLAALAAGARHVTAVEINPIIVEDVVRGRYREFTGDLYRRPDVAVHVEDGRSFLRRTTQQFDVVLLSMVDTSAATAAGAYSLAENGLYTTDAFEEFLARLAPGGVLSVSSASLPGLAVGARLVALARAAVERRGGAPGGRIAVVQAPWLGGLGVLHLVLVKPDGFTEGEIVSLERAATHLGFVPAHLPGRSGVAQAEEDRWIADILREPDARALAGRLASLPLDVSPVGDDRPFFFYQNRAADFGRALVARGASHWLGNGLVILSKVVVLAALVVVLFLIVPLVARRRELRAGGGRAAPELLFAGLLGVGFMLVELPAVQRLALYLGDPTLTLAVVIAVLLAAGGVGSGLLGAVGGPSLRSVLGGVVAVVVLFAALAPQVLDATATFGRGGRVAVAALLLAPVGVLLGGPFARALAAVAARAPTRVPWLFAVNSAASVLGSSLATLAALSVGLERTLLVGAGCYAVAALVAPGVERRREPRVG